jgi:hypothetical protein
VRVFFACAQRCHEARKPEQITNIAHASHVGSGAAGDGEWMREQAGKLATSSSCTASIMELPSQGQPPAPQWCSPTCSNALTTSGIPDKSL